MNIFVLDTDPKVAAKMMCDKHVVKMIVESAQMLSTIREANGCKAPYKPTHAKHPCTVWAGKTKQNYQWLYDHGIALCSEYTNRYSRTHKCEEYFHVFFKDIPSNLPETGLTSFAQAMPSQYKQDNAVDAYRLYYISDKYRFAKWKNSETPDWFIEGLKRKETVNA